ncbi:MAG TPA: cation:proton antiporter [Usitatibacter sp.]|jgi:Kef-type K+ transport system membrane component KefB|nr:cation:proton antiporter [Usitatibacter sp.]
MNASFLPTLPFELSYPLLFGVLLVAGMLGGEIARALKLPRMIGYAVVGFVFGPLAGAMGIAALIDEARIFVDLAMGLVLFDLGRRMDVKWMRRDWSLLATGLAESLITFIAVFLVMEALDFRPVLAGLAAAIAMTTSPAVVLLTVHDTHSEGQVTERALNLAALNGLLASIIVTIMLGSAHYESRMSLETAVLHPLYLFVGSLVLGAVMAWAARVIARAIERDREVHFSLLAGLVVAAVGLATLLKLPVILALLSFGLFARNDERGYALLNVNLAPIGRLLYIVLFVITGASLPAEALSIAFWSGLALVLARALGKMAGALIVAPLGGLRVRQAVGLGLALLPMSSVTLLLQHDIARIYPAFGESMTAMFLAAIIVMEVAGPIAVQFGLRMAGETLPDEPAAITGGERAA